MTVEKVSVTFPNGTNKQIDNPLYDYNFHPLDNREINGTVSEASVPAGGMLTFSGLPAVHWSWRGHWWLA